MGGALDRRDGGDEGQDGPQLRHRHRLEHADRPLRRAAARLRQPVLPRADAPALQSVRAAGDPPRRPDRQRDLARRREQLVRGAATPDRLRDRRHRLLLPRLTRAAGRPPRPTAREVLYSRDRTARGGPSPKWPGVRWPSRASLPPNRTPPTWSVA